MARLMRPVPWRAAAWVAVLAILAMVPLWVTDFQLFRLTNLLIYAVALLGMNILVGYNGQISLGHGAFYAIGAYTAALLIVHAGLPHWAVVPLAGALRLVVGAPALLHPDCGGTAGVKNMTEPCP